MSVTLKEMIDMKIEIKSIFGSVIYTTEAESIKEAVVKAVSEKGSTLDNCDYWLPIIRQKLNVVETYWHESNYATIWIEKEGENF